MKEYKESLLEVLKGGILLRRLRRRFGNSTLICISQHPGLGDAWICAKYLGAYCKGKSYVIISIGEAAKCIYKMYKLDPVISLSQKSVNYILKYLQFNGIKQSNVLVLHYQPLVWHSGIAKRFNGIHKLDFSKLIETFVFSSCTKRDRAEPVIEDFNADLRKIIPQDRSIIFFSESRTLFSPGVDFWKELIQGIQKKGYSCFLYSFDNNYSDFNIPEIRCELNEIQSLVEYAGAYVGVRSGIIDVVSSARCKKVILYPSYGAEDWIDGRIADFWSINSFGYTSDAIEIEWDKEGAIQEICACF